MELLCSTQRALVTLSLNSVGVQLPLSLTPNRDCVIYFITNHGALLPWTESHACRIGAQSTYMHFIILHFAAVLHFPSFGIAREAYLGGGRLRA